MRLTACPRCGITVEAGSLPRHRCLPAQRQLHQAQSASPDFPGAPYFRFVRVGLPGGELDYSLDDVSSAVDLFLELLRQPVGTRVQLTIGQMTLAEAAAAVVAAEDQLDALLGGPGACRQALGDLRLRNALGEGED